MARGDGLFVPPAVTIGGASWHGFERMDIGESIICQASGAARIRKAWAKWAPRFPGMSFEGKREGRLFTFTRVT